jgi:hypothetical protein
MFESEYVLLVIKPKIDLVLEDGVESLGDLTKKFNSAFECNISKNRITEWLKILGYRVTRTVQIDRPHVRRAPAPAPEPAPARMSEYDRIDMPARPSPFNLPAPGAVFSNVLMPGFQE